MYAPYYKHPYHPKIETLTNQVDRLFEIITSVDQFCISGGEPLLRKDLSQILDHLYHYKENIYKEILIITNGTILPEQDFLNSAQQWGDKVRIVVNDYGKGLSPRAQSVIQLLKNYNIRCELREQYDGKYYGGWVDYRNLEERYSDQEAVEKFKECANPTKLQTFILQESGLMYPCQRLKRIQEMGITIKKNEYVDIFDERESIQEKQEKINNFYNEYYSSCTRCDGMKSDSARFPAAEQLSQEELQSNYFK
jgi:organic radical activating enzyme